MSTVRAPITTDKSIYPVGQRVVVEVAAAFAGAGARLGIFAASPAARAIAIGEAPLRTLELEGALRRVFAPPIDLPPGAYEVRLFAGDPASPLARAPFSVVDPGEAALPARRGDVRVMSFNVWESGARVPDGPAKIAAAIAASGADIVGLQECTSRALDEILARLRTNPDHRGAVEATRDEGAPLPQLAIVSRHPIERTYEHDGLPGLGVRLDVGGRPLRFFTVHLTAYPYSPYEARDGRASELASVEAARASEIREIRARLIEGAGDERDVPVVVVGDFNAPSHLDWTPGNADQNFGETFAFPASTSLVGDRFTDAFRAVHPDPIATPGFTWTPGRPRGVLDPHEVHDRIDHIYVRGQSAIEQAFVMAPDPWPSDHAAVVAGLSFPKTGG